MQSVVLRSMIGNPVRLKSRRSNPGAVVAGAGHLVQNQEGI